jgi:hypothetical protein
MTMTAHVAEMFMSALCDAGFEVPTVVVMKASVF